MIKTMTLLFIFILVIGNDLFSSDWITHNMDNSGINSNSILVVKSIDSDEIWFGSYDNGISIFDGNNWSQLNSQNSSLPSDIVKAIAKDNSGLIWIGTENGLVSYDGINMEIFNSSNSILNSNDIMALTIDLSGDLWIGTWGGGITVKSNQNWTNFNSENSQLLCDYIEDITIGLDNIKVISVDYTTSGVGGIYIYNDIEWQVYNYSNSGIMRDWNHSARLSLARHRAHIRTPQDGQIARQPHWRPDQPRWLCLCWRA